MLHDKNTLDKDKPGQQPEEGDSCPKHIEQERCLHSLANAVHVNVRDFARDGKLLAGQGWLSTTATKLCEVLEVQKKRSQPVQGFRDGKQFPHRSENRVLKHVPEDEYYVRPPAKSTTKSWNWTSH